MGNSKPLSSKFKEFILRLFCFGCFLMLVSASSLAFNKCKINGAVVYQDAACPGTIETIAQSEAKKASYEAYFNELYAMAKKGEGSVDQFKKKSSLAPIKSSTENGESLQYGTREVRIKNELAMHQRNTEQSNAKSVATMTDGYNQQMTTCKGKLRDDAEVGMAMREFATCLKFRQFYPLTNIVSIMREGHEFRLYLYKSNAEYKSKIYFVDGIIAAMR